MVMEILPALDDSGQRLVPRVPYGITRERVYNILMSTKDAAHGRGSSTNPPNRFIPLYREEIPGWTEEGDPAPRTRFFRDSTRRILTTNDSPDIPFT
jgi:hypothetical protein